MGVTSPWFIDAWAVYDGVAFASRSAPEIRGTTRVVEAETTVFLSVPDLEPIPVGRITTGLRAARASYQDGYFDLDGTEIAFDSLEDIRQSVRRAYLACGLGPGGAATPPRIAPEPGAPTAGGSYFAGALDPADLEPDARPLDVVRRLLDEEPERLRRAVQAFGEGVVLDWEAALQHRLPATEDALGELYAVFADAGIWPGVEERERFVNDHHLLAGMHYLTERRYNPPLNPSPRRYSTQRLLTVAPCPSLPFPEPFSRLSDPLKLSLCDSEYLSSGGLAKGVPVLLAAMLVGVTIGGPSTFWHGVAPVFDHRMRSAIDWLERQLPRPVVPEVADQLLNGFARSWLQGPPPDLPGPASAPPSTGPSAGPFAPAPSPSTETPPEPDWLQQVIDDPWFTVRPEDPPPTRSAP